MTNRLMKDSRVDWSEKIPDHWNISKISRVTQSYSGGTPSRHKNAYWDGGDIPWVSSGEVNKRVIHDTDEKITLKGLNNSSAKMFPKNTVVVALNGQGKTKGMSAILKIDASTNQSLVGFVCIEEKLNYKFLNYIFKASYEYNRSYYAGGNKREGIAAGELKQALIPIPPKEEQQKIVSFLDEKVTHIDNILEDTKNSIEHLTIYKQSLITKVVTKGLDKNVDLKDSGVEWIGEIPSHWRLNRLKRLFDIKKHIANKLGYNVLSVTQKGLKIKDIKSNDGQLSSNYSKYQIVEEDDFVMNHMDLLTGWVDLSTFKGVTSPDYRVFKSKNESFVNNLFYKYIFQLAYTNKIFYGLGQGVSNIGRWRLQTDQFLNFELPIPPLEEQFMIAKFLDEKNMHINSLIEQKEQLIKELETYKKAMIYEYVTGKKEVE